MQYGEMRICWWNGLWPKGREATTVAGIGFSLGAKKLAASLFSSDPVVKASARVESLSDPIPEELRRIRSKLGFDYGKFDYGVVDSEVVLYDANRTPGTTANAELHATTVAALSEGLSGFLRCGRQGESHP